MKIVTLNVKHGGGSRVDRLLDYMGGLDADVIVLSEFRKNANEAAFRGALLSRGYKWQESSCTQTAQNAVFVASRLPFVLRPLPGELGINRHRLLAAQFEAFNLVGVYFPQGESKRPVFEYLGENVPSLLGDTGLIIGDFNTGRHLIDEAGKTFACPECLDDLEAAGLVDAWRSRNPDAREFTWYSGAKNGFRLDLAYCTRQLNALVTWISHAHEPRENAATDHSALVMEIGL